MRNMVTVANVLRAAADAYRALADKSQKRHDRAQFAAWSYELYRRVGDDIESQVSLPVLADSGPREHEARAT